MSKIVSKSARKFSKALFNSSHHENLASTADTLDALGQVWENDSSVSGFFLNPRIVSENKKQVLDSLIQELKPTNELKNFLFILLDNSKLNLLPEIALEFRSLYNHFLKSLDLSITTAQQLSNEEQEEIITYLKGNFGGAVQINWETNPEIIGGFIIKSGDQLLDSSVNGALEKIKLSLLAN